MCLQIKQLSVPAHSSGQLDKGSTGEENNIAFCSLPLPFVFVVSYCIAKLAFIRFCCVACTDECSEKYIGFMCKCILSSVRVFPCGSNTFWEHQSVSWIAGGRGKPVGTFQGIRKRRIKAALLFHIVVDAFC